MFDRPCRCGCPPHAYEPRPCCRARLVEAMHRSRPALAFWYMREIRPDLEPADLERFRALYREHVARGGTVSRYTLRAESCAAETLTGRA